MEKQNITEEMKIHEEFYQKAKDQTMETLPEFIKSLLEKYNHDYGTICHALTAGAIGTLWAMNRHEQGGITGFQAGCIMWEFIKKWQKSNNKLGLKLIDFDTILFPQYEHNFKNTLSKDHWESIKKEAQNKIDEAYTEKEPVVHIDVLNHWKSIVEGKLPFGFELEEE